MDTRNLQDDELVERLRKRDETAITDLLQVYGGQAKCLVNRMLGRVASVISYEDVLGEAVTKAWLNIDSYDRGKERFFRDYRIVTGLKRASKPLWRGATCRLCRSATGHGRRAACR